MVLDKETGEKSSANNPLEQFVLLAKGAKGAAVVELAKQMLDAPGVYVFGELLDMPNVKDLENGSQKNIYELLQIFAHGTYKDYLQKQDTLPSLTESQRKKLQHLTIVSLAKKMNCIPYSLLLEEIDIKNVRALEDLIIDAIYADIIRGKLDQKNSCLEVDFAIGRDFREDNLVEMICTLEAWHNSCESVLSEVESQITRANAEKSKVMNHRAQIEHDIVELKKNFKSQADDMDDITQTERLPSNSDKCKKTSKLPKMSRVSGKFWPRSDFARK
ncbi:hypothetical protein V9T40_009481 [Parthenolecanium corni]|uniref:PCI domain-containing protein n=1 Tax=Parthenolecanium corni TaxID=536013 RepID=A0AAN9TMU4_9HEMI